MASTVSREYAEGDGYFQIRFLMIRAHETLLNGLESVTRQSKDDHSADVYNWLGYVGSWASCVHHHHSIEEKHLFPLLEANGIEMKSEHEQHDKLHKDLDALSAAIASWQADPTTYDSSELESLLESLAPNFREHLREEVQHLNRERLEPHVSSQQLKDCIKQLEEEAKKGNPFIDPVFMMSHTPAAHKYWSNMGWFMYRVVIPALSWRHAGFWKYAPEPLNV